MNQDVTKARAVDITRPRTVNMKVISLLENNVQNGLIVRSRLKMVHSDVPSTVALLEPEKTVPDGVLGGSHDSSPFPGR